MPSRKHNRIVDHNDQILIAAGILLTNARYNRSAISTASL
jgi:hypothetical protein